MISAIQRFSIQDGPGIRTTIFFKGCLLKCFWCSNPETQLSYPQLSFRDDKCFGSKCCICIFSCKREAIKRERDRLFIFTERCSLCGECIKKCPESNLKIVGEEWSIDDLIKEILKDRIFYKKSGGGITLSGGEPLLQNKFVSQFVRECKRYSIHTIVDTCFAVDWEKIEELLEWVDLFYIDLKQLDNKLHIRFTGKSNKSILRNLERMSKKNFLNKVVIRIPFIPGVNSDEITHKKIINYIKKLNSKLTIHLLPYHNLGRKKYRLLGIKKNEKLFRLPTQKEINKVIKLYGKSGFNISVIK